MPHDPDRPSDDLEPAALEWIEANWNELAAFAWQGYVVEGRGILILQGDWHGEASAGYQTPAMAAESGYDWPQDLLDAVQSYQPATDVVFLISHGSTGTLLRMRASPPRLPPREAGQQDGSPPLVSSA